VRAEYDRLKDEFAFLDEILKARFSAGLTQAEVARRIGTTQSAVARLEAGGGRHSPSIATLAKYAKALGYRLDIRFVKNTSIVSGRARSNLSVKQPPKSGRPLSFGD
jgi:transcriptional regulator with XRE-family HTH domain